ncbi:MAG: peptidoglycan-binding domain-containing protein [Mesorhizobium sp.]
MATIDPIVPTKRGRRRTALISALLLASSALVTPALAQEAPAAGEAFATRFSGTTEITLGDGSRLTLIDENGVVASAVDVRNPGFTADGRHWANEPQHLKVTAAEVGQVFGIAISDGAEPSIYLTATSAFGLHRFQDGSDWLPGQFGEGGSGAIYVLSPDNGYTPQVFAIVDLDGRENNGAALGNIAFDSAFGQLFVSDLESGMIHRIALDGTHIDRFDHGTQGRTSFLDVTSGANLSLAAIAFDPESTAALFDCADGAGAPADFSLTPSCWNVADFRRRVWGLAVHTDPVTGETRLYYAVSGGDALGAADWAAAGDDAKNSVWSVGLDENGGFDAADVRREFILPNFGSATEGPRVVPDIAISPEGEMLVAERGGMRNLGLDKPQPFAEPNAARVLRYVHVENGSWAPQGRYDVGFDDRQSVGAPWLRAGAAGGVDFGYGYNGAGSIDPDRPNETAWMSGDFLCSPTGPCFNPSTGQQTDTDEVHGLQGTRIAETSEVLPAGATGPYPASGDPYPANGPLASYLIDLDTNVTATGAPIRIEALKHDATKIGDVEIVRGGRGGTTPFGVPQPQGYDLDIDKSGPVQCLGGTQCDFTITLTNRGPDVFSGPIYLWDFMQPIQAPLSGVLGGDWACFDLGTGIQCLNPALSLGVGQSSSFTLSIDIPSRYPSDIMSNCIAIQWLYDETGAIDTLAIQSALVLMGYDPGPVDGAFGPRTRDALAQFQDDNGLPATGEIDEGTIALLYPGLIGIAGDLDTSNDEDCHDVTTDRPPPLHSKWNSHLKIGSPHNKVQSHLKIGSPHNKVQSHFKIGSPHNKVQSHFKIGSPHDKLQSHLKIGSPHNKMQSHLKIGSPHDKRQSHLKIGSPHNKVQSHLKIGSPHNKVQSHLKIGSPHDKRQSHLKDGSPHDKRQSHLKIGSPHNKVQSHLKVGSPHDKRQSHLKDGSPHNKVQSHLKVGSPHDKRQSHLKDGSPHNKEQSHLKIGSPHDKRQSHLKVGSPHDKVQSHRKQGSDLHNKSESHLKTGSPHNKVQSHQKQGSDQHNKSESHLKTGSPHNKVQSHLKQGSDIHTKNESHRKQGSDGHSKRESHQKEGSDNPHNKLQSHLKQGSVTQQTQPVEPQVR